MAGNRNSRTGKGGRARELGELVGGLIEPALRKRGFASRDILENWHVIAPPPYNRVTFPCHLKWRRNEAGAQGALLFLRCHEGHRLALAHDHERIAAAVNQYFGYVLVDAVKLSAEPFIPGSQPERQTGREPNESDIAEVEDALGQVEDEALREALKKLGLGIRAKGKK